MGMDWFTAGWLREVFPELMVLRKAKNTASSWGSESCKNAVLEMF